MDGESGSPALLTVNVNDVHGPIVEMLVHVPSRASETLDDPVVAEGAVLEPLQEATSITAAMSGTTFERRSPGMSALSICLRSPASNGV